MKVCIWSTSFQADTLALALALDQDPEIELLVLTKNKAALVEEPVSKFRPLQCELLDRDLDDCEAVAKEFKPDVVFADNHVPSFPIPHKFLYHWHGLPLKIRPAKDLRSYHRQVERQVGSVKKPNPRYLAQCYGQVDYDHRINTWKLSPDNCCMWGSAYSDLLLSPPYTKADLEDYFQLDLTGRKTILLSITWHFGDQIFGPLGDDDAIFDELVKTANESGANVIFSLHDKYRYIPGMLSKIESWSARCNQSFIKYKSEHADNLADLVASDVMICSFSSFIVWHYFTGKPSLHILPFDPKKIFVNMPTIKKKQIRSLWRRNSSNLWMYPFSEHGGVVPQDGDELIRDLNTALENPAYGRENAEQFIRNRIVQADGNTSQRIVTDMKAWAG